MSLASPSSLGLLVLLLGILVYLQMILQAVLITQMLCIRKYSFILVEGREEDCFLFGRSKHLSLGGICDSLGAMFRETVQSEYQLLQVFIK